MKDLKMQVLALSDRLKEQDTPYKRNVVWRLSNVAQRIQQRRNLSRRASQHHARLTPHYAPLLSQHANLHLSLFDFGRLNRTRKIQMNFSIIF
jgi:hypothetical protein